MKGFVELGIVAAVVTLPVTLGIAGAAAGVALAGGLGSAIVMGAIGAYVGGGTGYVLMANTPLMVGTAPTSVGQEAKKVLQLPVKAAEKGVALARSGLKYAFNAQARKTYRQDMAVYKAEKKRLQKIANGPKGQPDWDTWGKARGDLWKLKKPKI